MNFVHEQHVAGLQVGQQGGQVAGALQYGSGCLAELDAQLVGDYMSQGRNLNRVALRRTDGNAKLVFGEDADWVRSEACLYLDFGEGRLPGMLAFAAESPMQFAPNQGTDLLDFMAGAFERAMRRWLG